MPAADHQQGTQPPRAPVRQPDPRDFAPARLHGRLRLMSLVTEPDLEILPLERPAGRWPAWGRAWQGHRVAERVIEALVVFAMVATLVGLAWWPLVASSTGLPTVADLPVAPRRPVPAQSFAPPRTNADATHSSPILGQPGMAGHAAEPQVIGDLPIHPPATQH